MLFRKRSDAGSEQPSLEKKMGKKEKIENEKDLTRESLRERVDLNNEINPTVRSSFIDSTKLL